MSDRYQTRDGDMVDEVASRYYGRTSGGEVEAIYAANYRLADLGPELPAGMVIELPDVKPRRRDSVRLFG